MEITTLSQNSFLPFQSVLPEIVSWADKEGTAFFDSSLTTPNSNSLLAIQPDFFLRGTLANIKALEEILAYGTQRHPRGCLAGAIDYEGNYYFGFYKESYQWKPTTLTKENLPPTNQDFVKQSSSYSLSLSPKISKSEYVKQVIQAKAYIAAGDIYQACITYPLLGRFEGNTWSLYEDFRAHSPAPHAAYLNLGAVRLLSASPELFLSFRGNHITTCPIKGTRRRPVLVQEESKIAQELLYCEKERAELTMITDLERNDLGRICEYGSVRVSELYGLKKFAQVFHLISTVEGRLKKDISQPAALAACFPGGSITGAPKVRAMQIIEELESANRGYYTGAIGWFGFDGNSQFNIAIRTLEIAGDAARYGTGAGIVADSDPEKEWQETQTKASSILGSLRK